MKLNYIERGQGAITLIFLHYFGGSLITWNEVIDRLENTYRCIAVDMLGFGKSPAPQSLLSVAQSAESVVDLIQDLQLSNYVLIGHSMGAKIAVAIAAKPVKGLQDLILIAPSPPSPEPMKEKDRQDMYEAYGNREAIQKMLKSALGSEVPDDVFNREVDNNLSVSELGWKSWPELGCLEDISAQMQYVHVPVHILYGEKDKRFTRKFLQKEYSLYFKTFSLTDAGNIGHLIPVEAPEETASIIKKLLG